MTNNKIQRSHITSQHGFSLLELLVAVAILVIVSAVVMEGLAKMSLANSTITNRTQMHSGVRSATEVLQQEIGQAGKIDLPTDGVTLTGGVNVPAGTTVTATLGVSSAAGMFLNEKLVIDAGASQETVTLTAVNLGANQITAAFTVTHAAGAAIRAAGGFANGVIPTNATNGSSATVLKLFGDINDDGNMVYIEYTCNTGTGKLYRNVMSVSATGKPAVTDSLVLLPNIQTNPGGTPCFTYQEKTVPTVSGMTYVLNVAVTLTVRTEQKDLDTNQYQTETKALLNVSPRNVYEAWLLRSGNFTDRVQSTPANVTCLVSATAGATGACPGS